MNRRIEIERVQEESWPRVGNLTQELPPTKPKGQPIEWHFRLLKHTRIWEVYSESLSFLSGAAVDKRGVHRIA
jgi:hypothetical protein